MVSSPVGEHTPCQTGGDLNPLAPFPLCEATHAPTSNLFTIVPPPPPPAHPPALPPPPTLTPQGREYALNPWGLSVVGEQGCPRTDLYGAPSDGEADWLGKMMDACYQKYTACLLYTSPSPRDRQKPRMPSSA